jgi:hypothetical protein
LKEGNEVKASKMGETEMVQNKGLTKNEQTAYWISFTKNLQLVGHHS